MGYDSAPVGLSACWAKSGVADNRPMPGAGAPDEPLPHDHWAAVGWALGALILAGLLAPLSLPTPGTPLSAYDGLTGRDLLRGEWLLAGALLAIPIYRAARGAWWTALVVCVVPCAQMLYIADTGVETLRRAGEAGSAVNTWYVVAALECGVFWVAALAGAVGDLGDRRWLRMTHAMMADPGATVRTRPPRR